MEPDIGQRGGAVADGGDDAVGGVEVADQGVGGGVCGEVEHCCWGGVQGGVSFWNFRLGRDFGGFEGGGRGGEGGCDIRPWPPTKNIAENLSALSTRSDSFWVVSQRAAFSWWKETHSASSLKYSTELGSRGALPPAGEATVISLCGARTL